MTKYVNERDPVVPDPYHIGQPDLRSDRLSPIHHQIVFYWIVIFSTSLSLCESKGRNGKYKTVDNLVGRRIGGIHIQAVTQG